MIAILATEGCFRTSLPGYTVLFRAKLIHPLTLFFGNLFHSTVHCKLRSAPELFTS